MTNPVYELNLHPTYYDKGFFNFGVAVDALIRPDSGSITIELRDSHRSIEGRVNRNANQNGTPRVHGGTELRDWFQANYEVSDRLAVHILSPTRIRLMGGATS